MCGRFTLFTSKDWVREQFGIDKLPDFTNQFNIAPSQMVLAIVAVDNQWHVVLFRWGLIPFWATDKKIGNKFANARSETVTVKPAFRRSFQSKRCLMLMSGFFEWQQRLGMKQPYYIESVKRDELLTVAALWDSWQAPGEEDVIQSCCLLTTSANEMMRPIHDRMPVILTEKEQQAWLNCNSSINELTSLLVPYAGTDLHCYPVSTKVNNSRYQGVDTINPIQLQSD
ncbi:hypothetical protein BN59_03677 [Legionella massiliensis]|uniref:Abasic site processing protein n=1 Tax=Legionella massiliensis TaxID=1034943 RepID=A0A078L5J2_9GAMM|nr:SOS response-associated peptidase [Legionella massiliensis]CDZ79359.1 hypothetical protein BN59_03677 [Legionella massiliensis]CEE15097.1 Putative SOS response-associated peptidase YedK [Legionella massiliensis]